MTGSFGAMGCFSFYANKVITTGEGGMVTTNDEALAERLRSLRNLVVHRAALPPRGARPQLPDDRLPGCVGLSQLQRIREVIEAKRGLAARYGQELAGVAGLQLPDEQPWAHSVYWMYAIVVRPEFGRSRGRRSRRPSRPTESTPGRSSVPMDLQPCLRDILTSRTNPMPGRRRTMGVRPVPSVQHESQRSGRPPDRCEHPPLPRRMKPYSGDFALLYDLFHREKPYEDEADFVDQLLRDHAQGTTTTLLDIACGTGRHAVRFATRGWKVVGIDQSADMLNLAAERARGLDVTLVQQDMVHMNLESREFDAAVCLFDSIGYGVDSDSISETLSGARRHLRAGGLFAAEFWHAPAMLRGYEPLRVGESDTPDGHIVRVSRTRLDVRRADRSQCGTPSTSSAGMARTARGRRITRIGSS